ncbi:hypothetical protein BJ912DRAFT_1080334 [Pholiota molesta]|nr:hypothetical protein BJ912DRAFT_1080334 [Pholiota molesta]
MGHPPSPSIYHPTPTWLGPHRPSPSTATATSFNPIRRELARTGSSLLPCPGLLCAQAPCRPPCGPAASLPVLLSDPPSPAHPLPARARVQASVSRFSFRIRTRAQIPHPYRFHPQPQQIPSLPSRVPPPYSPHPALHLPSSVVPSLLPTNGALPPRTGSAVTVTLLSLANVNQRLLPSDIPLNHPRSLVAFVHAAAHIRGSAGAAYSNTLSLKLTPPKPPPARPLPHTYIRTHHAHTTLACICRMRNVSGFCLRIYPSPCLLPHLSMPTHLHSLQAFPSIRRTRTNAHTRKPSAARDPARRVRLYLLPPSRRPRRKVRLRPLGPADLSSTYNAKRIHEPIQTPTIQ